MDFLYERINNLQKEITELEDLLDQYERSPDKKILKQLATRIPQKVNSLKELAQNPAVPDLDSLFNDFRIRLNSLQSRVTKYSEQTLFKEQASEQPEVASLSQSSEIDKKSNSPLTTTPSKRKKIRFHMRGYLKKQGVKGIKSWHRRWFALKGTQLCYFYEEDDPKPRGAIDLTQMTMARVVEAERFEIVTKTRVWSLQADTAKEATLWVNALNFWLDSYTRPKIGKIEKQSETSSGTDEETLTRELLPAAEEEYTRYMQTLAEHEEKKRQERYAREQMRLERRREHERRFEEQQRALLAREQQRIERERILQQQQQQQQQQQPLSAQDTTVGTSMSDAGSEKADAGSKTQVSTRTHSLTLSENISQSQKNDRLSENSSSLSSSATSLQSSNTSGVISVNSQDTVTPTTIRTPDEIKAQKRELLKEKEATLLRRREELQRLTHELHLLEAQQLEAEQHESDLDAQDPTVRELTDATLNNEKRIQRYTTAFDIMQQEIQQKHQQFETFVQQETQLDAELSTLEASVREAEKAFQTLKQELEAKEQEIVFLDINLQELRLRYSSAMNKTNINEALLRELEKQREAAEAHLVQRGILLEELQRTKEQCRVQWETLLGTHEKILYDLWTLKAKYFDLRGRSFQPDRDRFNDEISSLKKEYIIHLPRQLLMTSSSSFLIKHTQSAAV